MIKPKDINICMYLTPRGKQVNLDVAWWARRVLSIYFLRQKAKSKFKECRQYEGSHTSERSGYACISHVTP